MTGPDPEEPARGPVELRLSKDPWAHAPTDELAGQVLPRWFVLLALAAVVAAVVALIVALTGFGRSETPVAARRPPPGDGLTHEVGEFQSGGSEPTPYADACALLDGVAVAGTERDQAILRRGLAAVCNVVNRDGADGDVADALRTFAEAGGVVRFAAFTATGVDSTATSGDEPPQILINARFSRSDPLLIAPLIAHDVVARTDPGDAATAMSARRAEAEVCTRLFDERPRSCADAFTLLDLADPLAALRDAGYQ